MNGDGKKDILATTNGSNGKGAVFAFELVGKYEDGPSAWKKYVISSGYTPTNTWAPGAGAPGSAFAFHPSTKHDSNAKPYIIVSADDGGLVDLLTPNTNESNDWSYAK